MRFWSTAIGPPHFCCLYRQTQKWRFGIFPIMLCTVRVNSAGLEIPGKSQSGHTDAFAATFSGGFVAWLHPLTSLLGSVLNRNETVIHFFLLLSHCWWKCCIHVASRGTDPSLRSWSLLVQYSMLQTKSAGLNRNCIYWESKLDSVLNTWRWITSAQIGFCNFGIRSKRLCLLHIVEFSGYKTDWLV